METCPTILLTFGFVGRVSIPDLPGLVPTQQDGRLEGSPLHIRICRGDRW